jgi:hypothetical protein
MKLIEFKQKLENNNFKPTKIDYKFLNSIVVFNGQFDYPIKKTSSSIEYKMYKRVLDNYFKKKV